MSKMPQMSDNSRQRLVKAAEFVSDYLDQGDNPSQAVAKAANKVSLPPEHIPLLCQSTNVGIIEAQRLTGNDTQEKAAAVDIAEPGRVVEMLFGTKTEKKAEIVEDDRIPQEYLQDPDWLRPNRTKTAEWIRDIGKAPEKPTDWISQALLARRIEKESRAVLAKTYDRYNLTVSRLKRAFMDSPAGTYSDALRDAPILYGDAAKLILTRIELPKHVKEAKARHAVVDESNLIYSNLRQAISEIQEVHARKESAVKAAQYREHAEVESGLVEPTDAHKGCLREKVASGWDSLGVPGAAAGYLLGKTVSQPSESGSPAPKAEDLKGMVDARNANIAATLGNLLANDDVLSRARPEEVFHHYNELSSIAPLAMADPATSRAILRKRIEGGKNAIDPYDIDLALKIEKGFRDKAQPSDPRGALNVR